MEEKTGHELTMSFFYKNNTIIRMRKGLHKFSDDVGALALWHLLLFYFSYTARQYGYTNLPANFPFLGLMLEHFGTGPEYWTESTIQMLFDQPRLQGARHKWLLLFVFLSLDTECITWPLVKRVTRLFAERSSIISPIDAKLTKHLPNAPPRILLEADVLGRLSAHHFASVWPIVDYIRSFPRQQPTRSVLTYILDRIPFQELVTDESNTAPLTALIQCILIAHSDVASFIPDTLEGRIIFRSSTVVTLFFDIEDDFDASVDEELALHVARLTHPLAQKAITAFLLETQTEHRAKLDRELAIFYEKYPGQEPDTHQCPVLPDDHVCNFESHENTCSECCMNCLFDYRFEVYKIKDHSAHISVCDRLLPFFRAPTMTKGAE